MDRIKKEQENAEKLEKKFMIAVWLFVGVFVIASLVMAL